MGDCRPTQGKKRALGADMELGVSLLPLKSLDLRAQSFGTVRLLWFCIPALPLVSCVISSKLLNVSDPHVLYL